MATATWKAPDGRDASSKKRTSDLPDSAFAFPQQRKEPLNDASHVRNAIARFDQVEDVSDDDRELAFANIRKAAKHFDVQIEARSWRELGRAPHAAHGSRR